MIDLYRFYAADGDLLYVGISSDFGSRLKQHRRSQDWWHEVVLISVEHRNVSREEALEVERCLIRVERPKYNIVHNASPDRVPRQPVQCSVTKVYGGRCGNMCAPDRLNCFSHRNLPDRFVVLPRRSNAWPSPASDDRERCTVTRSNGAQCKNMIPAPKQRAVTQPRPFTRNCSLHSHLPEGEVAEFVQFRREQCEGLVSATGAQCKNYAQRDSPFCVNHVNSQRSMAP